MSKTPVSRTKNKPLSINPNTEQNTRKNFRVSLVVLQGPRKAADPKFIEAVADDLVRWARLPDVLTIESFYDYLPVCSKTVENWSRKYKCMTEAFDRAKIIIGVRREEGLIIRDYDRYTAGTLHDYLPRCRSSDSYHSKLKQEEEGNSNKIIYVRGERFPNSTLVPEIKKDKDE